MQAACEAGEVFALLEGGCGGARTAADALCALYGAVREPWVTRVLLLYHARTGSQRALELLARAPEPHARHLLDALHEQLHAHAHGRKHALAALAPLVARRPLWLRLMPVHPAARALLRAARTESEPVPLLHALLALAALVAHAPALAAAHAAELAEALVRAAASGEPHAALGARALFRAVYATHPCTAVEALRGAGHVSGWERGVAALARGVRLHPLLVTGSRAREADSARWARSEPHDVLHECRRLSLPPPPPPPPRDSPAPVPAPSPQPHRPPPPPPPEPLQPILCRHSPGPPPGSTAQHARDAGALRPGGEGWFALGERSGAESAPHTPLPAPPPPAALTGDPPDAGPEPEPAVEATPENTPRLAFRFPQEGAGVGGAARAIGRELVNAGGGAGGEAYAMRLSRVAAERRTADSPVPFGLAPPITARRPEPRAPAALALADPDLEDCEVRELTSCASPAPAPVPAPPDWVDAERDRPAPPDPRRACGPLRGRGRARGRGARRASSVGPDGARRCDAAVQTVDAWPEPYEFLLADFYRSHSDDNDQPVESSEPCERLDAYLESLYAGRGGAGTVAGGGGGELAEQLALVHAQLMYERWRREAHAERNRRLLGRCRHVRALELVNTALQDRVRALTRERDALRAAPPAAPVTAPAPEGRGEEESALASALGAERTARLRAEALLSEAEAARALEAGELQRARTESFEAARHVEALARAALAAERRAEHVRRLRRELLVLAERDARRAEADAEAEAMPPAAAPLAQDTERALRAAAVRAEAEAEAAGARAEASAARVQELEAAAGARDAVVAELKREQRAAAEEGAARLRALRDKYAALMCVVRAKETRDLEMRAAPPAPRAPASVPSQPAH